MGYPSDHADTTEGNADNGHSSSWYDAQFKPSSTNLPPLGNIISTGLLPRPVDSGPIIIKPISTPIKVVSGSIPATVPTPPQSSGGILDKVKISPPTDSGGGSIVNPPLIPPSSTTAQGNATTLQQQSQQAAAANNPSLAAALAAQAASWQSMANSLKSGSVVSPLSSDNSEDITASPDTTSTATQAGLLGNIKPIYLVVAGIAALFFFGKK